MAHYRFWITEGAGPRRLATKEEWIASERAAGFYPRSGRDGDPANAGWTKGDVSGHLEIVFEDQAA